MAKKIFIIFTLVFIVSMFGCKTEIPTPVIKVDSLNNGLPGSVTISTEGTKGGSKDNIKVIHYFLTITYPDGSTKQVESKDGKFEDMSFTTAGMYGLALIVSNSKGNSNSIETSITIANPFEGFAFNTDMPELSESGGVIEQVPITFSKNWIKEKFRGYITEMALKVVVKNGNIEDELFSTTIHDTFKYSDGLFPETKTFFVKAKAKDQYGNESEEISTQIKVISKNAPLANIKMQAQFPSGNSVPTVENIAILGSAAQKDVFEYSKIFLKGTGSKSSSVVGDDSFIKLFKYTLNKKEGSKVIFKDYVELKNDFDEAEFVLYESGIYEVSLEVLNNFNLTNKKIVSFTAKDNEPEISAVIIGNENSGELLYEALEYPVVINAKSVMPVMGEITKAVVTINDGVKDVVYNVPVRTGDTEVKFLWTAFYETIQNASQIYNLKAYVVNKAGRQSSDFVRIVNVKDNTPEIDMVVSPSVQKVNFDQVITITSSPVVRGLFEDGSLKLNVTGKPIGGTDTDITTVHTQAVFGGDASKDIHTWTFTATSLLAGSPDVTYTISLLLANMVGRSEARKYIVATNNLNFLTFDITGNAPSANSKYLSHSTIVLDASGSRINKNPVVNYDDFEWKIEKGVGVDKVDYATSAAPNGFLSYTADGKFNLTLGAEDYYTITLVSPSRFPSETVLKTILVDPNAPVINLIKATELTGASASRAINKLTPCEEKEIKFKLECSGAMSDSSVLINYEWYIDKNPALAGVLPDYKYSATDSMSNVEHFVKPGKHTVYVIASVKGVPSNRSKIGKWTFTVGRLFAPVITTSTTITNDKKPTWSWNPAVASSTNFRYQIKNTGKEVEADWLNSSVRYYESSVDLGDGEQILYVQEQKADGKWSDSAVSKITIDTVAPPAPTIVIDSSKVVAAIPNPVTKDAILSGVWSWSMPSSSEEISGYEYSVDNGITWVATTNTSPLFSSELVAEGQDKPITIKVVAVDLAGNKTATAASSIVRIDRIPPPAPINDNTVLWTNNKNLEYQWKIAPISEALSGFKLDLNIGATVVDSNITISNPTTKTWSRATQLANTAETIYTLSVFAKDLAGNYSEPCEISQTLDTVAPIAPTITGTDKAQDNFVWNWNSPEDNLSFLYALKDSTVTTVPAEEYIDHSTALTLTKTYTVDGSYKLFLKAKDRAGNESGETTFSFYRDKTPPVVTFTNITQEFGSANKTVADLEAYTSFTDNFDTAPNVAIAVEPAFSAADYAYKQRNAEIAVKYTATDNLGNETIYTKRVTINAPAITPITIPAVGAVNNDPLINGWSFHKVGVNSQYYQAFVGNQQKPLGPIAGPKTKIMLHDFGDTYFSNIDIAVVFTAPIAGSPKLAHLVGQRSAGTNRYVRSVYGSVSREFISETPKFFKGVTYRVSSIVAWQTAGTNPVVPGYTYNVINVAGATVLATDSRASTTGSSTGSHTFNIDWVPEADVNSIKLETVVGNAGANDAAGSWMGNYSITATNWPGKN